MPTRNYWQRGNVGFQAILNFSLALERLGGASAIDPMTDIPADSGLVAACQSCGHIYVRAR